MNPPRPRYLERLVREDLASKMVFIGGPRQVGKTTLAQCIAIEARNPTYLNWDQKTHRKAIRGQEWSPETDLMVFDEIHKAPRWKQVLKGIWDTRERGERVLVTGSSRLDVYRRGGDSLQGRYHYWRLHPFSMREASIERPLEAGPSPEPPELEFPKPGIDIQDLVRLGGFPEPFLAGSERILKRWHRERFERVFREDIREVEAVRTLSQLELLGSMLPERVASPLSMSSLSEDLEASPKTVKSWVELLSRNYYVFRVPPYHRRLARALKKESKYYLWDWSEVKEPGPRFENLIASHLLKFCHYHTDSWGVSVELYYLRDSLKREVDFLIVWERRPWALIECKLRAGAPDRHAAYFAEALNVPLRFVVTLEGKADFLDRETRIRTIPASRFLMALL